MATVNDSSPHSQATTTRGVLAQFLYPIRTDLAAIMRRLDDIDRRLDQMAPRRRGLIVTLRRPETRR